MALCVFLYYVQKFAPLLELKVERKVHKICEIGKATFPHFTTFLCNFTNFKMLFLAVVMNFVFPA